MAYESECGGRGREKSGASMAGSVDSASILTVEAQMRWIRDFLFLKGGRCRLFDHSAMERAARRFYISGEHERKAVRGADGRCAKGNNNMERDQDLQKRSPYGHGQGRYVRARESWFRVQRGVEWRLRHQPVQRSCN